MITGVPYDYTFNFDMLAFNSVAFSVFVIIFAIFFAYWGIKAIISIWTGA